MLLLLAPLGFAAEPEPCMLYAGGTDTPPVAESTSVTAQGCYVVATHAGGDSDAVVARGRRWSCRSAGRI